MLARRPLGVAGELSAIIAELAADAISNRGRKCRRDRGDVGGWGGDEQADNAAAAMAHPITANRIFAPGYADSLGPKYGFAVA